MKCNFKSVPFEWLSINIKEKDRRVGLGVSVSDYQPWGRGFDSRHFHNVKCGLGLDRGPPILVRIDWKPVDSIKEVDIDRLNGA